jgi:DNA-binding beta-propeller fold protein YncE
MACTLLLAACSESNAPTQNVEVVEAAPTFMSLGIRPGDECVGETDIRYLCGVINGEDILQIGSSDWLLVSGMDGSLSGNDVKGKIHLVNAAANTVEVMFPGATPVFQHDSSMYPDCPGPIDITNFSAHGLSLQKINKGPEIYRVYMTSHGAREAIEVFEVDAFLKPTIQWVGCIPMPESSWTNSVTILSDGGFLATQFFDPSEHTIENVLAGEVTGHVFEWHPGEAVSIIAGTELAGPNGIAVSLDERWIFVAAFGAGELVRFDTSSTPAGKEVIALGILPDNVRWTSEGSLYVAGNNVGESCGEDSCEGGWSVVEVTPYNLAFDRVGGVSAGAALHDASSALLVNDEIWVGTFSGDRLAILPR